MVTGAIGGTGIPATVQQTNRNNPKAAQFTQENNQNTPDPAKTNQLKTGQPGLGEEGIGGNFDLFG